MADEIQQGRCRASNSTDLLADLVAFSNADQRLDSLLSDGCYHGFGDARSCPNEGCAEAGVVRAWFALLEAASELRKFDSANASSEAPDGA
ncbi:hypothetical protein HNR46_001330 [Haloferula luteola]|uniref:Uncharacterized protein n=1 Tax=Haloferula luteola TaxID=595692 RepID=A0A840V218_9BACT|nr:hypothetical protein [Haloferula luteola]